MRRNAHVRTSRHRDAARWRRVGLLTVAIIVLWWSSGTSMHLHMFTQRWWMSVGFVTAGNTTIVRFIRGVNVRMLLAIAGIREASITTFVFTFKWFFTWNKKNNFKIMILQWNISGIQNTTTNFLVNFSPNTCKTWVYVYKIKESHRWQPVYYQSLVAWSSVVNFQMKDASRQVETRIKCLCSCSCKEQENPETLSHAKDLTSE